MLLMMDKIKKKEQLPPLVKINACMSGGHCMGTNTKMLRDCKSMYCCLDDHAAYQEQQAAEHIHTVT
jgi:hypothetical protein